MFIWSDLFLYVFVPIVCDIIYDYSEGGRLKGFIYLKKDTTFWQVKVPFCNLSIYPILFNVHYCDMDSSAAVMSL